ncbi:MAG TPA: SPW repeat protein [Ferrovibrio sp.]|uniref:SPW repeat protein n=1 Tax=Ferrovibrio sp. TaxID=1917215 RepID=UPI002ED5539E
MASLLKPFIYRHWQDWADLMLGVVVLISPWIIAFTNEPAPTYNAIVVGVIIIALCALAISHLEPWEEWLNVALGVWLIVSPWILDYDAASAARACHVGLGLIITLMAASELWEERQPDKARGGRGSGRPMRAPGPHA